jgi:predicted small lipoprotein YifL
MPNIASSNSPQTTGPVAGDELKTQNSKLKTSVCIALALAIALVGCGKEGLPLPPEIRVAERTTDLTAFQEGDEAILRWSYPVMTTAGQNLTEIEEIQVWRAALPLGQEPPPPISPQDRQMQRQLLEGQGEILRALGSDEIATATRGSAILIRDDLEPWRQTVEDPELFVLWYGVRTVCCRHRESELSNVVRLEPQAPPDPPIDLGLEAGADGIDVRWTPAADTKTLIERSADGAAWTAVTEEPLDGDTWRDENAPQGQAWSFRLRSVIALPGGNLVVGMPSQPARVDHPDTYPPAAPSDVVCLPEGAQVRVRWQAVAGAVVYSVSRQHGNEAADILTDDHRSIEFTDREPPLGELVYFVTARDAAANRSEEASCEVVMGAVP